MDFAFDLASEAESFCVSDTLCISDWLSHGLLNDSSVLIGNFVLGALGLEINIYVCVYIYITYTIIDKYYNYNIFIYYDICLCILYMLHVYICTYSCMSYLTLVLGSRLYLVLQTSMASDFLLFFCPT